MMNYAHIQNNIVVNVVVADAEWIDAQSEDFVLIENQNVQIGSSYENGVFVGPQPYPSWTRDGNSWKAPIAKPDGVHAWNEESLSWVPFPDAG
jgi:hypothetical protein